MRIGVVHNPLSLEAVEDKLDVFAAYEAAITTMDMGMAKTFITKLVKEENVEAIDLGEKTLDELAVHVSNGVWLRLHSLSGNYINTSRIKKQCLQVLI
jgi:hypothetical protein